MEVGDHVMVYNTVPSYNGRTAHIVETGVLFEGYCRLKFDTERRDLHCDLWSPEELIQIPDGLEGVTLEVWKKLVI